MSSSPTDVDHRGWTQPRKIPHFDSAETIQFIGHRLASVVQPWKAFTAREANAILCLTGQFWQRDYFDRYMRNEVQLERTIAYVEANPVHAGLVTKVEDWSWSSARFRCETGQ